MTTRTAATTTTRTTTSPAAPRLPWEALHAAPACPLLLPTCPEMRDAAPPLCPPSAPYPHRCSPARPSTPYSACLCSRGRIPVAPCRGQLDFHFPPCHQPLDLPPCYVHPLLFGDCILSPPPPPPPRCRTGSCSVFRTILPSARLPPRSDSDDAAAPSPPATTFQPPGLK